ncbi:uncharacterized protein C8orf88 homolog [Silurus meridionalis]|uniref:Uncharacterized protein n=1 Tax=Silurus meridionalis TaxID=175797 RepID=A0A8T0BQ01_SILME|nr:uncharacterized protein C8orf88 homolog [Silurus meridionalis]XP_046702260.1 uncharacterized protein C8orf88 homolog [Silurus meridionalis]XP_046702261.1 uncharacterized protein C8orf88 homolog [Silurus meridionalis]KAF7708443.1 hypothetical protein HF521_017500 [Silurus meridionalis]
MEGSTRRMRNLKPARPLRRLNCNQVVQTNVEAEPVKMGTENPLNHIIIENCIEVLKLSSQSLAPAKSERISYSRDFLISLANSPMAKKRPDYLPSHPVVLVKGRELDTHKLLGEAELKGTYTQNKVAFVSW